MAELENDGAEGAVETPSMEETALAAYDAAIAREDGETAEDRPRGPDGKFIAKSEASETAPSETAPEPEETTDPPEQAGEGEAETPPIAAPASWSAEEKADFVKLPPATQAIIAKRESERESFLTRKAQELAQKEKAYEQLSQVLAPRRQQLAINGLSEAQAINQLFALSDFATHDLPGFIKYMAQQRGLDLRSLIEQPGQTAPVDPALAAVQRATQQLDRKLSSFQQAQEQAALNQVNHAIETFRNETVPGTATAAHPHFDAVRQHMAALMQTGLAQSLQDAYDQAVMANPPTRALIVAEQAKAAAEQRIATEKERAAKAKKAAGTQIVPKGTTTGRPIPRAKTIEETAREVADRIYGAA